MQQLILGEPFCAIFYSPYYVAEALGAFGRHGLEVQMLTAGSADLSDKIFSTAPRMWRGAGRCGRCSNAAAVQIVRCAASVES
jgi:hypothetical protein